jgi:uroporphyrinogen-III decarboxylase
MFKDPDIGKPAEQLRKERYERIHTAWTVGIPDRVPVNCPMGYFPARYTGIPFAAAYTDFNAWYAACEKTLQDFRPDSFGATSYQCGEAQAMLELKTMKLPGFGVNPYHGHQSIEIDGLKTDEFDLYMKDPTDYMLRVQLPRISDKLKGLGNFPPLYQLFSGPGTAQGLAMALSDPEVEEAIDLLRESGHKMRKEQDKQEKFRRLMESYGYYATRMVGALPPFDIISHSLSGMRNTMLAMFRQSDKLIELCDFILSEQLKKTPLVPDENGDIRIFMTNTRGIEEFLSKDQFERFYWPTCKKLITTLCERGATPNFFIEGHFDSRIEYLLELPKGKFTAGFEASDIIRAKEILKDHCCISGNVPVSLLQVGTEDDVIAYCKKLIDNVGKDGGFILSPSTSVEEVNPRNLKAMIEFTKEYGVYR